MAENNWVTQVITPISGVMGPYLQLVGGHLVVFFLLSNSLAKLCCKFCVWYARSYTFSPWEDGCHTLRQVSFIVRSACSRPCQMPSIFKCPTTWSVFSTTWQALGSLGTYICWDFCLICLTHWHIYVFLKVWFTWNTKKGELLGKVIVTMKLSKIDMSSKRINLTIFEQ